MAAMKWKPAYATGNKNIDDQHKTIFASSEEFRDVLELGCSAETYQGFLEFLAMYIKTHFGYEEECMYAHACPIACQNKEEHTLFMKVVEKEEHAFLQKGYDPQRALNLLDKIDSWLDSHIGRIDIQLKDYIGKNKHTVNNPRP